VAGAFDGPASVVFTGAFTHRREIVVLLEPLIYADAAGAWLVDVGARSDGCSVPWWAWWMVPPLGREARAAFLHDQLLSERPRRLTRVQIDRKFREAMRCLGTPLWKRNLMWLAVRWNAFRNGDR
jgi:hypothetical protein